MATRGSYGFYKNGISKLTYNHFDSDLKWLGQKVLNFLKDNNINTLNKIFDNLRLVSPDSFPNESEKSILKKLNYEYIEDNEELDWGSILESTLGNLDLYKQGLYFMLDYSDFIKNSLFCEWAYIINLDNNTLEIYKGFQETPEINRYYVEEPLNEFEFYNCKLMKEINFSDLKDLERLSI